MRRADRAVGAALVLGAALLAGCSAEDAPTAIVTSTPAPSASPAAVESYVALGDSFTAAPYVPVTDLAEGCLRSSGNYPALLAEALGAELTDVSCSGADTTDLTGPQSVGFGGTTVPPQLDAVQDDTDLVTVGIGGNDQNLFGTLVYGCTSLAREAGTPCADRLGATYGEPSQTVTETGRRVAAALTQVRRAAPEAMVVLVGYPRIIAADAGCAAMPLADGDRPLLADLEKELNEALAQAARDAGVDYLDVHALSEGHEVCSDDPWVNGRQTDQARALSFHPFAEEQQAVADALEALLEET